MEDEIEECNGNPTTVVTFFHSEMEDINAMGVIHTGDDDPFMKAKEVEKDIEKKKPMGFEWHGRSLEDGVYEVDDDMDGLQPGTQDGEPLHAEQPGRPVGDDEIEEVDIDGEKYTKESTLAKLREALRLCGLPRGKSKADAWKRLVDYRKNFAENMGIELARREFERRKLAEGGDGVRPQSIPRMPTKAERQVHELTHWPYEDWCEHCVAARGKSDPHRRAGQEGVRAEAKSEYPVVSMDFCYTRSMEDPSEEDREEFKRYGGDLRGGLALVVTDDWTHGVLALPVPAKGRAHIKYIAEQVVRWIGACGFSTCTVKADGEPSMRMLVEVVQQCR